MERPLVQILVVVANIQMRTLKTEVEEGFLVNSSWTRVSRSWEIGKLRFKGAQCIFFQCSRAPKKRTHLLVSKEKQ